MAKNQPGAKIFFAGQGRGAKAVSPGPLQIFFKSLKINKDSKVLDLKPDRSSPGIGPQWRKEAIFPRRNREVKIMRTYYVLILFLLTIVASCATYTGYGDYYPYGYAYG